MNDKTKDSPCSKAEAAWLGAASGAKFGAVTGAICAVPLGLLFYGFAGLMSWIIICPIYGAIGAVLGVLTGAIVGTCCAATRSVLAGWLAGSALALAIGLIVLSVYWFSVEDPVPPNGPINPAASTQQQGEDTRRYREHQQEWADGERNVWVFLVALPAALCCFLATLGAAWRLERLHPEWD